MMAPHVTLRSDWTSSRNEPEAQGIVLLAPRQTSEILRFPMDETSKFDCFAGKFAGKMQQLCGFQPRKSRIGFSWIFVLRLERKLPEIQVMCSLKFPNSPSVFFHTLKGVSPFGSVTVRRKCVWNGLPWSVCLARCLKLRSWWNWDEIYQTKHGWQHHSPDLQNVKDHLVHDANAMNLWVIFNMFTDVSRNGQIRLCGWWCHCRSLSNLWTKKRHRSTEHARDFHSNTAIWYTRI